MAKLNWNGNQAKAQIADASAAGLLRAAVYFQTFHKQQLNKSNPRPYLDSSQPGEYPKARTGFGRGAVLYEPTTVEDVAKEQAVRIGYLQSGFYMLVLELRRHRLGLLETLRKTKDRLAAIATGG